MRQIKFRQWYFLLILFFCFHQPVFAALPSDIEPTNILEKSNSPILINHLVNYDLFVRGRMIVLNDVDTWNRTINTWNAVFANLGGYNDSGDEVPITLQSLDTSQVDLAKPGYYTVTVHLQILEPFSNDYILDKSIQSFSIPICVTDPQQFDLFIIGSNANSIDLTWRKSLSEPLTLYYIDASTVLTDEMLTSVSWNVYQSNIPSTATVFSIQTNDLTEGHEYYFYLQSGTDISNYVHLSYTEQKWNHEYMGGDRDGGDSLGNHLPEYEQPAPTIPDSNSNHTSNEEITISPSSDTTASSSGESNSSWEPSSIPNSTCSPELSAGDFPASAQELSSAASSTPNPTESTLSNDSTSVVTEFSSISQSVSDIGNTIPVSTESISISPLCI